MLEQQIQLLGKHPIWHEQGQEGRNAAAWCIVIDILATQLPTVQNARGIASSSVLCPWISRYISLRLSEDVIIGDSVKLPPNCDAL